MAKVKLPCFSVECSGKLSNAIVFSSNNIVRFFKMYPRRWKRRFNQNQLIAMKRFAMRSQLFKLVKKKLRGEL